jgi:hypothetical protein
MANVVQIASAFCQSQFFFLEMMAHVRQQVQLAARKLRVAPETRDEVYCEVNRCDVPPSDRAGDTCFPPARKLQPVSMSRKQAGLDNQSNKGSAGIKVASR